MTYKDETQTNLATSASSGRFRAIACNNVGEPIVHATVREFTDLHTAIRAAMTAPDPMTTVYVYDDMGTLQAITSSLVWERSNA
jgi:hypothetical protein